MTPNTWVMYRPVQTVFDRYGNPVLK